MYHPKNWQERYLTYLCGFARIPQTQFFDPTIKSKACEERIQASTCFVKGSEPHEVMIAVSFSLR
jgi:hypothetical protein